MSAANQRPEPTPDEILAARARRLARPVDIDTTAKADATMLAFTVGRERYAVDSRCVVAVIPLVDLVPLPGARAPVVGLTRWRGDVLTVLDVRSAVGGVASALDDLGRVIVIGEALAECGILADIVDELASFDPRDIHAVSATRRQEMAGLVTGVTAGGVHLIDIRILIVHQNGAAPPASAVLPSTPASP